MLNAIVRTALRQRSVVFVLAAALLAWGFLATIDARLDVFPEFAPPQVSVQTEAPGMSAEQVELLVTKPVEKRMGGVAGLETLRSQSIQGLSIVTATFSEGTEPITARQVMSERLALLASELPAGVRAPELTPLTSATMDLLKIGLVSDTRTPMELRHFAQWVVQPRLLAVPGVANVSLFGGEIEQMQIRAAPERLTAAGLVLSDLVDAARNATGTRGAGFFEGDNQRVVLQTHGALSNADELAEVVVASSAGRRIRIGDVADVGPGPEPKYGDALVQGRPGVLMTMVSQFGANTMDVTRRVELALDEMQPAFDSAGIHVFRRMHRPATFIEHSIANLRSSLLLGAVLVAIVLFLFLYDLRTAFISLITIPLSLGTAVAVMYACGVTLNTITLGGLAVALGEVVDDAIIDVENIFRRLRENRALGGVRSSFDVVLGASLEVRSSVIFATALVGMAFVPVLTLSGLQGRMFAPLALAYLLAVGASLVIALVVTPALCLALLPSATARARETRVITRVRALYRSVLATVAAHPRPVVGVVLALCAGCALLVSGLAVEFIPTFREGHFVVHVTMSPGTSLPEMRRVGASLSEAMLATPYVATVEQQIGRSELGEDPWPPNRSEFHIELVSLEPAGEERAEAAIRAILDATPGIQSDVLTFLGDRIGETISGDTAQVSIGVHGADLDRIEATANSIAEILGRMPGSVDVQTSAAPGVPTYDVDLVPGRLALLGMQPAAVLEAVQAAVQGDVVARIADGDSFRDVVVTYGTSRGASPEVVADLKLRGAEGAIVPLSAVADLHPSADRGVVFHEAGERRAVATCNVDGRDIGAFVAEARTTIERDIPLPEGVHLVFGGEAEVAGAARTELLLHSAAAFLGILVLLGIAFRNVRNVGLVVLNLPFALGGGVVAATLAGGVVSLGSLVGFVTLFGITTRNSIMMLSHFDHLVRVDGATWNAETALRGAGERFVPILMTGLVTGLGLLPLALAAGAAGREIEGPMATVILGGLLSSTALNLLVLPSLALRFGRFGSVRANPAGLMSPSAHPDSIGVQP